MNQHLQAMRAALSSYMKKAQDTEDKLSVVYRDYKPEVARAKEQALRAELTQAKAVTWDAIDAAKRAGKEAAERWGELNVADITDDAKLLSIGLKISQDQFDELCRKYHDNGTMSQLLGDYADRNNKELARLNPGVLFPPGYLLEFELQTPVKKGEAWERLAQSAEKVMAQLSNGGWMGGANNPINITSVENFGLSMEGEL